jgi:hypothetical protein
MKVIEVCSVKTSNNYRKDNVFELVTLTKVAIKANLFVFAGSNCRNNKFWYNSLLEKFTFARLKTII